MYEKLKTYRFDTAVVFKKNNEAFGAFSIMSSAFPMLINGHRIRTSEALYQALKFPDDPDIQMEILEQASPMAVKYKARKYSDKARKDWDLVKVQVMEWVVRAKVIQNLTMITDLLIQTGTKDIVESSNRDQFWGAKPINDEQLVGENQLGEILMRIRKEVIEGVFQNKLLPPDIRDFKLLGKSISTIEVVEKNPDTQQLTLF